jgi:phosphoesterase RecJ-like protein
MKEAFELIKESKNVLLHLHPKPDPDSVGSALATYHALRSLGKEVTVIQGDSVLPERFSFLPGYESIVKKKYFEINLSTFDLFIIQDSGSKHMVSREKEVIFPSPLKTLVIDHHQTNDRYGDINLVDTSYAATAEFLYDLFLEWGIEITRDIAACLYIGIYGDTGGFHYSNTTTRTMQIGASLTGIYPEFTKLIEALENNQPKEKIFFDRLALNSIETFYDDKVALVTISYEMLQKNKISIEQTDSNTISNMLITVKEWIVGATLIEKEPGVVGISFRSKEGIDVSKIAVMLGGGGHKLASGARLVMPLEDAKKKVIDAIGSAW